MPKLKHSFYKLTCITDHGAVYLPDYTQDEIQKTVNQSIAAIKEKEK